MISRFIGVYQENISKIFYDGTYGLKTKLELGFPRHERLPVKVAKREERRVPRWGGTLLLYNLKSLFLAGCFPAVPVSSSTLLFKDKL